MSDRRPFIVGDPVVVLRRRPRVSSGRYFAPSCGCIEFTSDLGTLYLLPCRELRIRSMLTMRALVTLIYLVGFGAAFYFLLELVAVLVFWPGFQW